MDTTLQELQDYLSSHFPGMRIDTENTLAGEVTIKFQATEDDSWEEGDRINQAVERGVIIFRSLFERTSSPLWILAYEYEDDNLPESDSDYLFRQFMPAASNEFITNVEEINSRMTVINDDGEEVVEKVDAKITVGKAAFEGIEIESILRGIANKENGLEPAIVQSVYFFDPVSHTGFHMFDDRGIFAWSNEAERLRSNYNTYINWIPDYTKEDIEEFFK